MKRILQTALAVAVMGVVGCSSQQTRSANQAVEIRDSAVSSIDDMKAQLAKADMQLDKTQASMNNLTTYQGDLRPVYSRFTDDVEKTKAINNRISDQTNTFAARTARYTNDWAYKSNDIRDDGMRRDSVSLQNTSRQQQQQLITQIDEFRGAYMTYIQRLNDVQAFAATNLSADGQKQLRNHTNAVTEAARNVRQQINKLQPQLIQVASTWRSASPVDLPGQQLQHQHNVHDQSVPAGASMDASTQPR